ncbi:MAG: hypothetical protein H7281_17195 [Bacteriovorax sp.]|nr:hypothetical protein [Bacteriovorax sp.]
MNSKVINYLFILSIITGCGVKAHPLKPPDTAIRSYTESYTGAISDEELNSKKPPKKKK